MKELSLSNINIHFLPPNTTAHLQPLDAGIIRAFKAHYRARLLAHVVEQFDAHRIVNFKIDLAQAFRFITAAWSQVTAESIVNCWRTTGITAATAEPEVQESADDPAAAISENLGRLRNIVPNIMTAAEYLTTDACVEAQPLLTDEEIIAQVTQNDATMSDARSSEGEDGLECSRPAPQLISDAKARTSIENLLVYVEQKASTLEGAQEHHTSLLVMRDAVQKLVTRNVPQRRITEYFSMHS